ncbi:MAG: NFACT RNA binding domain-containing protein [Bacteroidota bacterium]
MYKNYFFLNRHTSDLNNLLKGFALTEAFSQEKEIIVLVFSSADEKKYLLISVNQNTTYCLLRDEYSRARKNSISFFQRYLPAKLDNIEIAADDRVIRFSFRDFRLYYFIRGKDTNFILIDNSGACEPFKKIQPLLKEQLQSYFSGLLYSYYFHLPVFEKNIAVPADEYLRKNKPYIGKELLLEAKSRCTDTDDSQEILGRLSEVIEDIRDKNIAVLFDSERQKHMLAIEGFRTISPENLRLFSTYNEALNDYLSGKYKTENIRHLRDQINKKLNSVLEKTSQKLNEVEAGIARPSREEQFRQTAGLLLANIHLLKKGMKEIEIESFYENAGKVKIILNDTLDAQGNVNRYFEKARDEKQTKAALISLKENLLKEYRRLLEIHDRHSSTDNINDLRKIMKELDIQNPGKSSRRDEPGFTFRHYVIDDRYSLYVGKDSRSNDNLTLKFAKQNDFWFHARGVPGSHAVLRVENTKEVIPKTVIKKAASIAAFHSKAKTSKMTPVAYTLKKYVTKRKGMEPGQVALLREDVIMVQPGIPEGCTYEE